MTTRTLIAELMKLRRKAQWEAEQSDVIGDRSHLFMIVRGIQMAIDKVREIVAQQPKHEPKRMRNANFKVVPEPANKKATDASNGGNL